jgi:hypothetical protein
MSISSDTPNSVNYCHIKKRELFSLLMRDRAADWLLTLPKEESATYARLVEAF